MDLAALGQLFVGVSSLLGIMWTVYLTLRVKKEVTTLNSQSLPQYADAAETRRVTAKQESGEALTAVEQEHIDTIDDTGRRKYS